LAGGGGGVAKGPIRTQKKKSMSKNKTKTSSGPKGWGAETKEREESGYPPTKGASALANPADNIQRDRTREKKEKEGGKLHQKTFSTSTTKTSVLWQFKVFPQRSPKKGRIMEPQPRIPQDFLEEDQRSTPTDWAHK